MNNEVLKNYKAKADLTSLYDHNLKLIEILDQLNLDEKTHRSMLKVIYYHDIGKIADSFQNSLTSTHRKVRHEMLSASVKELSDIERISILTHHKSLDDIAERFITYREEYLQEIKELEVKLGIEMIDITKIIMKYRNNNKLLRNAEAILIKGLLNYCDHLGSSPISKLDREFNALKKFEFDEYTSVQEEAKKADEDIVIIATTGSGKTESSLYWANNIDKKKDKKIFYILPYTASINAMYQRFKDQDISVGMLHSKTNYFLHKEIVNQDSLKETQQSYRYFTKKITISTIYQLFKAIFNCKFNEMMFSMFKDSLFIIDEIHCYDEKQLAMTLITLKFLKEHYNINLCIMSASIPKVLLELIKEELNIDKVIIQTPKELESIKRHRVNYKPMFIEDDLEVIKQCIINNKRVLICVNTVQKSQDIYNMIKNNVKVDDISLLHSNFNTRDREKIEKELKNKKVLIGTQTIEVSLDIDYDVMFTEVSPLDSQIQRWGRINRKRFKNIIERKPIYIYDTLFTIYDKDIIRRTKDVLISMDDIHEQDLQRSLDIVYKEDFKGYLKYRDMMVKISDECRLGVWDNTAEYNEFTGATVIPYQLEDDYDNFIDLNKYHEANGLLVNISEKKFESANRDKKIIIKKDSKIVIQYNYDNKIGLQFGVTNIN